MKSFKLNSDGDLELNALAYDNDLMVQNCECVLGTNKGEWFGNTSEGIRFHNILGKNVAEETVKNEVFQGLLQVDSSFILTEFSMQTDNATRKATVTFTARNESGETAKGVKELAQ